MFVLIKELNKEGKTIFIISYNMDEVEKLCTRIAIMKNGKIISEGTMTDLRQQYQSILSVKIMHAAIPSKLSNQLKPSFKRCNFLVSEYFEIGNLVRGNISTKIYT